MGDWQFVKAERHGAVGLIWLNRPEKLNAMNTQLNAELVEAIDAFERDESILAIVLTGAGERAFSAGGDMAEQRSQLGTTHDGPTPLSPAKKARECPKPVLAAIRGYCYGGAANLAVNCDIRICGDDAKFRFVGASYGLVPSGAMLPRIVGEAKAKELLFTTDVVDAAEAHRIGLANQVVPAADVLEHTLAMAQRIAANSPLAVQALKVIVDASLPPDEALAQEAAYTTRLRSGAEHATRFRAAAERVVGAQ